MTDLVEFLTARYGERQQLAEAASWSDDSNVWTAGQQQHDQQWYVVDSMDEAAVWRVQAQAADDAAVAKLVAANDPAFVLADIAAKRAIIEHHLPEADIRIRDGEYVQDPPLCTICWRPRPNKGKRQQYPCTTLRLLAAPYAEHADFQPEWRLRD